MQPLRYARLWLAGGFAVLLLVLTVALLPGAAIQPALLLNDKALHLLTFVCLMVWFCGVFGLRWTPAVALVLLAYGGLIEVLQGTTRYRTAESGDVAADLIGILLGWALAAAGLRHWCGRLESWLATQRSR